MTDLLAAERTRAQGFALMLLKIIRYHERNINLTGPVEEAKELIRRTGSDVLQRKDDSAHMPPVLPYRPGTATGGC